MFFVFLANINLLLFFIYFYKKVRHGLHILQLENYYNDRYAAWMKNNIKIVFDIKVAGLMILPIVVFLLGRTEIAFTINFLAYLLLIITTRKKKEKKAFVVTARIKRMYITYLIIFAILLAIANYSNYVTALMIANLFSIIAYTFVYIANVINRPVEKLIRVNFCRKARKTKNITKIYNICTHDYKTIYDRINYHN